MTISHLSYHLDGTLWGNPTAGVIEYQQEHMEGPHIASFAFESGVGGVDDNGLRAWFDNRLMTEFATRYEGVEVWRGLIWEMRLEMGGEIRVKSMSDMANAVKTHYTNTDGDKVHTGFVLNDESIRRYGRKERVVTTSDASLEEATERADVELLYSASPYTTVIGYQETNSHRLVITIVGRMVVANNVQLLVDTMRTISDKEDWGVDEDFGPSPDCDTYLTNPDDVSCERVEYEDEVTVSYEIKRILNVISHQTGWLYPKAIADNDTVTVAGVSSSISAFARLRELAKLRNSDGEFYRLRVLNDGGVIYEKFREDVSYLRYSLPRGLETTGGTKPTWDAKPGIIKYVDMSSGAALPDTWLSDRRLSYYDRTVMRDGDSVATFHGLDLDATDIFRSVEANQRWIEAANR